VKQASVVGLDEAEIALGLTWCDHDQQVN